MSAKLWPTIRKAAQVKGKTLIFRNATVDDADFILSLRTDQEKSRYLSTTSSDSNKQRLWLESYSVADDQAYFIIEFNSEPIGTVRLYDARQNSFCWGSWILKAGSPTQAAIESALMVYAYAVDHLGFRAAHFDVRKGNESVWQFHERFGARRISETNIDYFYKLDFQSIKASCARYSKFLPEGLTVFR
jgi:RimJ/RimL family protein N-acetyltransferase